MDLSAQNEELEDRKYRPCIPCCPAPNS